MTSSSPLSFLPSSLTHIHTHTNSHLHTQICCLNSVRPPVSWCRYSQGLWTRAISQFLNLYPSWHCRKPCCFHPSHRFHHVAVLIKVPELSPNWPGAGIGTCQGIPRGLVFSPGPCPSGDFFLLQGPRCCLLASLLHSCQHILVLLGFSFPQTSCKEVWIRWAPFFLAPSWAFPSSFTSTPQAGISFPLYFIFPANGHWGKRRVQREKSWTKLQKLPKGCRTKNYYSFWCLPIGTLTALADFLGGFRRRLPPIVSFPSLRWSLSISSTKERPNDMILIICLPKCYRFISTITTECVNQVLKKIITFSKWVTWQDCITSL